MRTSELIHEIAAALAKAQAAIEPAAKDSTNPHFRSKYASLLSVNAAILGPLTANGLSVVQEVAAGDKTAMVTTRLVHGSGQWIEFGPLTLPVQKNDAHGFGSAITYARRYGLAAAVSVVADEDDDGNAAVQRPVAARAPAAEPKAFEWDPKALADAIATAPTMDTLKALGDEVRATKGLDNNARETLRSLYMKRAEALKEGA